MYYRAPEKAVCADVIPFYENGEFKLFYLRDYRDISVHGEGCPWCLLTSSDLVHFHDHGPVLLRGGKEEQDLYVFTGCCIRAGEEYMIFYTGHNPHLREKGLPEQKILRATSRDLLHWEKDRDFVFAAPDWLEMHDFRDPFVFYDEERKEYCMLIAGRLKNGDPSSARGVTLLACSPDLTHWEVEKEPFYAPHAYFTHECPDLFRIGDWWYLVFSEFTDRIVTTYRMSRSPFGPWVSPKINSFDGHAFYAAKSASDGKRRILFGWNCIKQDERDDAPWQWGGTIIPHEIVQQPDGTLAVKCPQEVAAQYPDRLPVAAGRTMGSVSYEDGKYLLGGEGKSLCMLGAMPENGKIELSFTASDDCGDFGLLLRADAGVDAYYAVRFEPRFNRLAMDIQPRADNTRHTQVDVERWCPVVPGEKNKLLILFEGSVLEVYVNDKVAMSARMFDRREGDFGIFTHNTSVCFEEIGLYRQEEER
ncbi:MAG TPA: family 43 glycosylhydrolase [Candidatus Gallimonas intestinavium]|uniref:beta-fructofuranosidase n=1 Tax=Candidatus Gallimonas intestinavium TaxID=2838603 RepID=A0A9D2G403_9FIRM|nr:family 43 glycosylhydrolase [Candidatus Gallimonas intestinavium]